MVDSIIEGLRAYIAECPLLEEISTKKSHIDWTSSNYDGNYGIFPVSNNADGSTYINGDQEMRYIANIFVRKMADTDHKRLESVAWLERLQMYFSQLSDNSILPEMPPNCIPESFEVPDAGLYELDATGKKGTYTVQIILNYIMRKE